MFYKKIKGTLSEGLEWREFVDHIFRILQMTQMRVAKSSWGKEKCLHRGIKALTPSPCYSEWGSWNCRVNTT